MTIEIPPKLSGLIPLWKRREMNAGTTIRHGFGGSQWSMEQEYHALDEDSLADRSESRGLAVEPEDDGSRAPNAESSMQKIVYREGINKADIGVPLPFISGIIRVVTWRESKQERVQQPQRR